MLSIWVEGELGDTEYKQIISAAEFCAHTKTPLTMRIMSHGGAIYGMFAAIHALTSCREANGGAGLVAIIESHAFSAAAIISQTADVVVARPYSFIGSIGVIQIATDNTEAFKKQGIDVEYFKYPAGKAFEIGKTIAEIKSSGKIDEELKITFNLITEFLSTSRGIEPDAVLDLDGGIMLCDDAQNIGLVNYVT